MIRQYEFFCTLLHKTKNFKANSLFHTVKYKNHSVGYIFHTVGYKSRTVKQRIFQSVLRNILLNFELILPGLQIIKPVFFTWVYYIK